MSGLQYSSYPGFGQQSLDKSHYSQAVVVPSGPTIVISGQGGWDRTTGEISTDLSEEMAQAFDNVDYTVRHTLEEAGHTNADGMSHVYKLNIFYTAEFDNDAMRLMVENVKKWFPNHAPTATGLGVRALALPGMRVEVEAFATVNK